MLKDDYQIVESFVLTTIINRLKGLNNSIIKHYLDIKYDFNWYKLDECSIGCLKIKPVTDIEDRINYYNQLIKEYSNNNNDYIFINRHENKLQINKILDVNSNLVLLDHRYYKRTIYGFKPDEQEQNVLNLIMKNLKEIQETQERLESLNLTKEQIDDGCKKVRIYLLKNPYLKTILLNNYKIYYCVKAPYGKEKVVQKNELIKELELRKTLFYDKSVNYLRCNYTFDISY